MCSALRVSHSGYYDWRCRPESNRSIRHKQLSQRIRSLFDASDETYGAVRICRDLQDEGERISKNTVAVLMRKSHLIPKTIRRFRVTTDSRKTKAHPNVLNQNFSARRPNERWVTDITAIPTREGWLYLCTIIDLYSRAVVGWSMSKRMKSTLVTDSLSMAIMRRQPQQSLLIHSDQGSQYGSQEYQQMLKQHGMICSMSRKGHCWDNAVAESFFHTLKTERIHHEVYKTRTEAKLRIFDYIVIGRVKPSQ